MCSHAPVVRLKNPGLLHSLHLSNSTHGCLVGKELVIPIPSSAFSSSFHIPFSHTTSICILFASTSPHVSRWPCYKETKFFIFRARHRWTQTAWLTAQVVLASGEASWSWKSNSVLSSRILRSCGAWTVLPVTEMSPQSQEKEMNSDNLMGSINQQVSDGNTQARMKSQVDWLHWVMNVSRNLWEG